MIQENVRKIKENIVLSCQRRGSSLKDITIVAVTKTATIEGIKQILDLGLSDIGENRIQGTLEKYKILSSSNKNIRWHMVGHLQTNKVKEAVKIFDLIHSVDSLRLADVIDREAAKINKIQDILVQVNTSLEATKFGIKPNEAIEIIKELAKLKNLNIKGLMTIAPIVDNPEETRPYFKMLREIRDEINSLHITHSTLHILSMGMTDDYQVAIEEGATMIRLGRAIFGH